MHKLAPIMAVAVVLGTACSPEQEQAWRRWFARDADAAVEWAVNDCGDLCTEDTNRNGIVEPDVVATESQDDSVDGQDDSVDGWGQCSQWMDDALAAGWTEEQWGTLNWIMARESGCDPSAYNPSGATGLLQIMSGWADDCGGGSLYDPWFNLSCGLHVYRSQGWSAWSVY